MTNKIQFEYKYVLVNKNGEYLLKHFNKGYTDKIANAIMFDTKINNVDMWNELTGQKNKLVKIKLSYKVIQ